MIPGFADHAEVLHGARVAWSEGGDGPPVLLLHGFPQTRALWARIGPELVRNHRVIAADLRGYGDSEKPAGVEDASFRAMGRDLLNLMSHLGHARFHLIGHDRGARTAHRMVLDAPERIATVQLLDIIPTHLLLSELRQDTARAYFHWFFLSQPEPFPERLIGADPDFFFETCMAGLAPSALEGFDAEQMEAYRTAWRKPEVIRGLCNDYRAAIDIDVALDAADLGRRMTCPVHVLWGAEGVMGKQYDVPATWADRCAAPPRATPLPGGHFFPDTAPRETAAALAGFLADHPF
ncbi:fluoroacetate dehalogenase [Primorskyibacter flagellatus]|uniref:Fluoroacetate dehalogenase n=1 Tax=Primorskyibacter flagellatus TaxID=1387277 RepID=A0A917A409_9RHOB|nr:alpha/beta hydrolase [Primorskyibacter flagellatus]GGE22681.1 fluoroacetate dehalogenase [Primorskyibacter flagellatus]